MAPDVKMAPLGPAFHGGSHYHRRLLALACPKSGTKYLTWIIRNTGVKAGHEMMGRDGTIGMFFAVEDCWYPGKHWCDDGGTEDESRQRRSDYTFDIVWHWVRDPRRCIPSMASAQLADFIWCWQERHTGISAGLFPKKLRAMQFWVTWNEIIEKNERVDHFFRIEDLESHWPTLVAQLGLPEGTEMAALPKDYGTHETGPRATQPMSWQEMRELDPVVASRVMEMAERYGYDTTQEIT